MRKNYYSLDELLGHFDLKKVDTCQVLEDWQKATYKLTATEENLLKEKHTLVKREGPYWNEEELKVQFISFVLHVANINEVGFIKTFFERSLKATIKKIRLSVKCDCLVATPLGINTPKSPYFFLQEFKKGKGDKYDPEAQMMAAMLIAQHINDDQKPVYGGFVVGQFWNFSTLIDKKYCVSRAYDATQWQDLLTITYVLRHLRSLIVQR